MVQTVRVLAQYNMPVTSIAGGFGANPDEFVKSCELAAALNTDVLAGNTAVLSQDRAFVIDMLHKYGLRLGIAAGGCRT